MRKNSEFYHPAIQGCRQVDDSYKFLNRVAEGTYGVVFRAEDKKSGEICALKRLKMEKEREGFPITSLREIVTLLKGQFLFFFCLCNFLSRSQTRKRNKRAGNLRRLDKGQNLHCDGISRA